VLDVGCGVGTWLRAALDLGAEDVVGMDGTYVDQDSLLIERERFLPADLAAQPLPDVLGDRATAPFDLIICMEVAEHLPHTRASSLVAEMAALTDVVLFSAAVPFQYGTSHINEQWPEYWSILFRGQGFECFDPLRAELWNDPDVDWWYAQNALLFARPGTNSAMALPAESRAGHRGLSRVHPSNLLSNLLGLPRRYREHASQEEMQDLHSLVEANRRGDTALPALAGPARAATAAPDARDVFPWTRNEIYHPEREIADLSQEAADLRLEAATLREAVADLSRKLGETGDYLQAANQAFEAERDARVAAQHDAERCRTEAQAQALARQVAETELALQRDEDARLRAALEEERLTQRDMLQAERDARLAAQRDAERARREAQAHAVARQVAQTELAVWKDEDAKRREALDEERRAAAAELAATRKILQAEYDDAHSELHAHAVRVQQQDADLTRRLREVDAVRRSRVWRASRRAQALGGRIARHLRKPTIAQPLPPVPESVASEIEPETPPAPVAEAAPEKPQIKQGARVLGDVNWWTLAAAITRLKRLETFDAADYLRRNPDVAAAGLDPYAHFIQSGALEGRGHVDPEDLARIMSGLALFENAVRGVPRIEHDDADLPDLVADVNHIGIFVSTHGNVFMEDLADDLAADLRSVGVRVDVLDETSDISTRPPTCLFVAPHEFFILGRGTDWVRDDVLSEGFMFGTEQVQTTWFNTALPFVLMSRGLLDICKQTADLFERLDMATLHILPGARLRPRALTERDRRHPLYGVLPASARGDIDPSALFAARPIDISFFGASSPRRDQFFSRNAGFFAEYETFNYCRRPGRGPIRSEGEDGALSRLAGHVAGHSKIMLNIHREEFGYFEWHRMVRLGMCSGSLVVSDPCLPHPDFVAGEHYFQENLRHIPNLLEWLLTTEDGGREAERVRANVDTLMASTFGTKHTVARMLRFFAQHRSRERG
jgi:SAM-dependent methyltransferase